MKEVNIPKIGWLSPSGELHECNAYGHLQLAYELVKGKIPRNVADQYLLEHGWVVIYRGEFFDHDWHICWTRFLSENQISFLRPIFENPINNIDSMCIENWTCEVKG